MRPASVPLRDQPAGLSSPSALARLALLSVGLLAMLSPHVARSEDPPKPLAGLTFDHYYDNAALKAALETIHRAYPEWTTLESMGNSREGGPCG